MADPVSLEDRIRSQAARASESGALRPIPTACRFVETHGTRYEVRVVTGRSERHRVLKPKESGQGLYGDASHSPFLPPYLDDLFVSELGPDHVCLLNRFNVVDHHVLIVTREFEDQAERLGRADFAALTRCMAELGGLAFYNGGEEAGASQRHKHLQLVRLPLAPDGDAGPAIPIAARLDPLPAAGEIGRATDLPFAHALCGLDPEALEDPDAAAIAMLHGYADLLAAVGLASPSAGPPTGPYNLLISTDWMLLVPRSTECFDSISVNALGFAGAFLARDEREFELIRDVGPLTVLERVGVTRTSAEH